MKEKVDVWQEAESEFSSEPVMGKRRQLLALL